jgi:NADH-quinone oxidoreductase subunit N
MPILLPTTHDLFPLLPELALVLTALAVLLIPIFSPKKNILASAIAVTVGLLASLAAVAFTRNDAAYHPGPLFGNLFVIDPFGWSVRLMLVLFTGLVMALWFTDSHDKFLSRGQAGDAPEFFLLLLLALLGMCLMASTTHLMMIFVAIETASLPSYVLAGFRKTHRIGAEAAMKYVLFGAASAAVMVYGISLLYGLFGSLDLRAIGSAIAADPATLHGARGILFALGTAGLLAGIGFKIAMVPMHFWCPDVFEGASIDVTTFLAVASKAAGLALLMRVAVALSPVPWIAPTLLALGIVTCFWGNLAAYPQTNIKRLLAWSSVAHAGYMLIGMSALLTNRGPADTSTGLIPSIGAQVLLFYLFMYLFMNTGAFIAAAAIAQRLTGPTDPGMSIGVSAMVPVPPPPGPNGANGTDPGTGEELEQYAGLMRRAPILAATMLVFLLSLTGIPLTIGFATKIKLFAALFDTGSPLGWLGVAAVGINTVIAAFYYFRVIRQMYLTPSEGPRLIEIAPVTIVAVVLAVPNILLFIGYGWVDYGAHSHAWMIADPAPITQAAAGD